LASQVCRKSSWFKTGKRLISAGVEQTRVHDLKDAGAMLDVFQKYGHKEVDTARVYGGGSSEEYLGELNWKERGLIMETKL
jgi:aflatoxin B1 aldehyde reductase